jgi:hypothetical protein
MADEQGERITVGAPLYVITSRLEETDDKWIGPFGHSQPQACDFGVRGWFYKSEVATKGNDLPCNNGEPVTKFTFRV